MVLPVVFTAPPSRLGTSEGFTTPLAHKRNTNVILTCWAANRCTPPWPPTGRAWCEGLLYAAEHELELALDEELPLPGRARRPHRHPDEGISHRGAARHADPSLPDDANGLLKVNLIVGATNKLHRH